MGRRFASAYALPLVVFCALVLTACGGAHAEREPLTDKEDVRPTSGLGPCSERQELVRAVHIEPRWSAERVVRSSFGAKRSFGVEENVGILPQRDGEDGLLRVRYPKRSINFGSAKMGRPLGGASFYAPFAESERLCLHYKVRFPNDFAFAKGGKLPGLYAGKAPSGGQKVTGENGWSMRLMWRRDGKGELYEYIVNKKSKYGLSVGRGIFAFPRGRWVDVDLEVVLNEEDKNNGIARLWIDGTAVVEQTGIIYTTEGVDEAGLMFSTFFGGNDGSWASPKDQHVDFADFRMYAGAR